MGLADTNLLYIYIYIYIFGREGVTPTKVALLLMPLVIELMLGEVMATMMVIVMKLLFTIIVAKGEMMA
jgi:hypothetical protein